jgi:hypothetical protein
VLGSPVRVKELRVFQAVLKGLGSLSSRGATPSFFPFPLPFFRFYFPLFRSRTRTQKPFAEVGKVERLPVNFEGFASSNSLPPCT